MHARVEGAPHNGWEDPRSCRCGGRASRCTPCRRTTSPLFTLARLPETRKDRARAEELADRLEAVLDGGRMRDRDAWPRSASATASATRRSPAGSRSAGRERARRSSGWFRAPKISPRDALLELARRHLHVYGPTHARRVRQVGGGRRARRGQRLRRARAGAGRGAHAERRRTRARVRRSGPP